MWCNMDQQPGFQRMGRFFLNEGSLLPIRRQAVVCVRGLFQNYKLTNTVNCLYGMNSVNFDLVIYHAYYHTFNILLQNHYFNNYIVFHHTILSFILPVTMPGKCRYPISICSCVNQIKRKWQMTGKLALLVCHAYHRFFY